MKIKNKQKAKTKHLTISIEGKKSGRATIDAELNFSFKVNHGRSPCAQIIIRAHVSRLAVFRGKKAQTSSLQ